ncbi:MAG: hypothetical protein JXR84_00480 [Anaerolineae bacterium]|nr:hypothetical protein [Anaerolineae bacterium]
MLKNKKRIVLVLGGFALVAAMVGVWFFGTPTTASAAANLRTVTQSAMPGLLGEGYLNHGGGWDFPGIKGGDIDYQQLLAGALGITVDELQAARETANQAAIDQAIAEGLITQEQADAMQARKTLMGYLDRDTLLANALGMSLEDLQAAYADGETLTTLMQEKGLDAATVREKLQTAYTEALAQAVEDGVITQEQADEMARDGHGFGMMPGGKGRPFEGHDGGGRGGRGGHRDGGAPVAPDTDDSDNSGTGFDSPSRTVPDAGTDA